MDISYIKIVFKNGTIKRSILAFCVGFLLLAQNIFATQITASSMEPSPYESQRLITVHFENEPLTSVLHTLARKVKIAISYHTWTIPDKEVTYQGKNISIYTALEAVLEGTELKAGPSAGGKVILIKKRSVPQAVTQQTIITGTVTDAGTGEALPGVNILVIGTTTGTTTDGNGKYKLDVESLQDTLRFSYIGYKKQEVAIKGRTSVDVALKSALVGLDELVVTGVGVATEKRKLGNSVGTVKSKDLENISISNPTEMLSGHVSGLVATSSGGSVSKGTSIRLRGSSSLSLQNQPVMYVDGIRIDNHTETIGGNNNFQTSRLNDINPADIDNIQVLKGAAAATLYGSQANAGVIQIFTKAGQPGKPKFNFSMTQSVGQTPNDFPGSYAYNPSTDKIDYINAVNKLLGNSYRQEYSLSAGGGGDNATYYASFFYNQAAGVIPQEKLKRAGGRLNTKFIPNNMVTVRVGLAYTNTIRNGHPGNGSAGNLRSNMILANPRQVTDQRPNGFQFTPYHDLLNIGVDQNVGNLFASGQINVDWGAGINSKVSLGYNLVNNDNSRITPVGNVSQPNGERGIFNRRYDIKTVNINTSWKADINKRIQSNFLAGAQAYFSDRSFINNLVQNLAAPSINILRGAGSILTVDEFKQEVKNAGIFVQEQLGFWNNLFVTGGVRFDGSSAFGSALNAQAYPKAGISYTPSTDFLEFLSSLRIRGSFGESGQQPGAFDAQRTYTPVTFLAGENGFEPNNLGNKELKPDRSKAIEVGFDAGFMNEKVNVSFTYFNQHTSGALFPVQFPPSQGFLNAQLENIGKVSSEGFEISVAANALESQKNKSGYIKLSLSTLNNKVGSLGGSPPLRVGNAQRAINTLKVGLQPGALVGKVVDPDNPYSLAVPLDQFDDISQVTANVLKDESGEDAQRFLGNTLPTLTGSLFLNFGVGRFNAAATIIGAHGSVMWDETDLLRSELGPLTKKKARIQKELKNSGTTNERKKALAKELAYSDYHVKGNWVDGGDYIRLQDITFGYRIPTKHLGVDRFDVKLSFKNLFTITNYDGFGSPGASTTSLSNSFNRNQDYLALPLSRSAQIGIKLDF